MGIGVKWWMDVPYPFLLFVLWHILWWLELVRWTNEPRPPMSVYMVVHTLGTIVIMVDGQTASTLWNSLTPSPWIRLLNGWSYHNRFGFVTLLSNWEYERVYGRSNPIRTLRFILSLSNHRRVLNVSLPYATTSIIRLHSSQLRWKLLNFIANQNELMTESVLLHSLRPKSKSKC